MYNLQKAKEEIDVVAKHTGVLTEHVLAVAERIHALESDFGAKLDRLKTFVATIEASFSNLQTAIGGGDFETSVVSDLGAKITLLHKVIHGSPPDAAVPDGTAGREAKSEPVHPGSAAHPEPTDHDDPVAHPDAVSHHDQVSHQDPFAHHDSIAHHDDLVTHHNPVVHPEPFARHDSADASDMDRHSPVGSG